MADRPVMVRRVDRVAVVTLNRPEVRNALDSETLRLLPSLVADAEADPDVDVIVLTGADPAFCAGLDLKELGSSGANIRSGMPEGGVPSGSWRGPLPVTSKPLIGAINGPAITGGLELALACDLLVASERARFADTHARVGIHPGWGLTVLLPQAVGVRRAKEMSATGRLVDAGTALTWGLVNHVVPHEELLEFTLALAADMVAADQEALRHLFDTYDQVRGVTDDEGWEIERQQVRVWMRNRGFHPGEVASRREDIVRRGSAQV